jgi:hypothetical protein
MPILEIEIEIENVQMHGLNHHFLNLAMKSAPDYIRSQKSGFVDIT